MAGKFSSLLQTWWKLLAKDGFCNRCKERTSVDSFVRWLWEILGCVNREGFTHTGNRCSKATGGWSGTGNSKHVNELLTCLEIPISFNSITHPHQEGWTVITKKWRQDLPRKNERASMRVTHGRVSFFQNAELRMLLHQYVNSRVRTFLCLIYNTDLHCCYVSILNYRICVVFEFDCLAKDPDQEPFLRRS